LPFCQMESYQHTLVVSTQHAYLVEGP
jgi:hypothetical protein